MQTKITVYLDQTLSDKLKEAAKASKRSRSAQVAIILDAALSGGKVSTGKKA